MDINVNDYLTDEQKQEIAEGVFRNTVRNNSVENWERIISNAAYDCAAKIVEQVLGDSINDLIANKAIEIIENLTAFTVFKKADVWDRQESKAYMLLQDAVVSNKDLIDEKVKKAISHISKKEALEIIKSKNISLS